MRQHAPLFLGIAALGLCMNHWASGQVFDVSAGVSTLYGAKGASVAIHGGNSETSIGAGLINRHLSFGASSTARVRGGSLTTGQQQLSMELPTDIFGGGPILSGIGAGYHTTPTSGRTISGFVGVSSMEGGTPLFQSSSQISSPIAFVQWRQPLTDSLVSMSTASITTRSGSSILESLSWKVSRPLVCAFTAGFGGGHPYAATSLLLSGRRLTFGASYVLAGDAFQRGTNPDVAVSEPTAENISAEYHLSRSLTVSGLHRNYITPISSDGTVGASTLDPTYSIQSSLDDAAIQYHRNFTVLSFTTLHSRSDQQTARLSSGTRSSNMGLSVGFTRKFRFLEWNENFYTARNSGGRARDAYLVSGIAATINPHLRLTQSVTHSSTGLSFAHGGALVTRFSSFEVDYQLLYLAARPEHPFQQAMIFDSKVQVLHNVWLEAASSIGPTGTTLYTFRLGKQFAHAASETAPVPAAAFGESVLRGIVVDQSGAPVEGASLMVDSSELYTDSKGEFFFREKLSRGHNFTVVMADFIQVGTFSVISAPRMVHSAPERNSQPLTIVVKREGEREPSSDSISGSTLGTRRTLPVPNEAPR